MGHFGKFQIFFYATGTKFDTWEKYYKHFLIINNLKEISTYTKSFCYCSEYNFQEVHNLKYIKLYLIYDLRTFLVNFEIFYKNVWETCGEKNFC